MQEKRNREAVELEGIPDKGRAWTSTCEQKAKRLGRTTLGGAMAPCTSEMKGSGPSDGLVRQGRGQRAGRWGSSVSRSDKFKVIRS